MKIPRIRMCPKSNAFTVREDDRMHAYISVECEAIVALSSNSDHTKLLNATRSTMCNE